MNLTAVPGAYDSSDWVHRFIIANSSLSHVEFDEPILSDFSDFRDVDFSQIESMFANFSIGQNSSRSDKTKKPFQTVMIYLNIYLTPVIILVGLVGNLLSFLVFMFTHVQRQSSSIYLSSLAVADIMFLLAITLVWMDLHLGVTVFVTDGWCQVVMYVTRVSGFMAVWTVLSFTAERYIVAYHPLKKDLLCTRKKAIAVVVCLSSFALLFYTSVLWTYDVVIFMKRKGCGPMPAFVDLTNILMSFDTVLACAFPSIIIVILNIKIMIKIQEYQKLRSAKKNEVMTRDIYLRHRSIIHTSISVSGGVHIRFSTNKIGEVTFEPEVRGEEIMLTNGLNVNPGASANNANVGNNAGRPPSSQFSFRPQTQFRTARMLLVLSSIFVLLNLPYHISNVHLFFAHLLGSDPKASRDKKSWHELFQLLYFLNFAINFFIYSACGRQFRVGLSRLGKRWKRKCQCQKDPTSGVYKC